MTPSATLRDTVHVDLGARRYDILIGDGLVSAAGEYMGDLVGGRTLTIIADAAVASLHLGRLEAGLTAAGIKVNALEIAPGEASKSFSTLEQLLSDLLRLNVERKDLVVAFGGGVVGDLTGFAAAILRRGIDFIQVPTTLLAQVDSSVGGKTGINTPFGKNLIGSFHQPKRVLIDLDMLATLPPRELRAGYAEIVKYGLIDDLAFFTWLEANGHLIVADAPDREAQAYAVAKSCRAKARIVAEDEREAGKRALLNLGHTFGHALEAECGYDGTLLHGEAVAIGMVMALDLAARLGLAPGTHKDRLIEHLRAMDMRAKISDIGKDFDPETLIGHMKQDKKVDDGKMVFIAGEIGDARILRDVETAIIMDVLDASLLS